MLKIFSGIHFYLLLRNICSHLLLIFKLLLFFATELNSFYILNIARCAPSKYFLPFCRLFLTSDNCFLWLFMFFSLMQSHLSIFPLVSYVLGVISPRNLCLDQGEGYVPLHFLLGILWFKALRFTFVV